MEKAHQEKWKKLVDSHWWPVANHSIVKSFINRYLKNERKQSLCSLDIGCSNGKMTQFLTLFGPSFGIDISFDAMLMSKDKALSVAQADAAELPFKEERFDVVTLLDVAEHVQDDEKLFSEVKRVMKKGGYLFIMVPAHMVLWGSHDVKYGHKRRYLTNTLKKLAGKTGFNVQKLTYIHPTLFPVMLPLRMLDRNKKEGFGQRDDFRDFGPILNKLFEKLLILDGHVAMYLDYPFGTTIFSVWRKN